MPTLDWIGKKAVVNHHREVPYRLLHCDKSKSAGDPDAGNLLVQGDNLEALKALLPYYDPHLGSIVRHRMGLKYPKGGFSLAKSRNEAAP